MWFAGRHTPIRWIVCSALRDSLDSTPSGEAATKDLEAAGDSRGCVNGATGEMIPQRNIKFQRSLQFAVSWCSEGRLAGREWILEEGGQSALCPFGTPLRPRLEAAQGVQELGWGKSGRDANSCRGGVER